MMELLSGFPDNVLAVKASGQVTQKDYETVLIPAAQAALRRHEKLRVYYEIASDFTGFDLGAVWEDFIFGVGHVLRWERVATVTSVEWIIQAVKNLSFLMPCPVKAFTPVEAAQAKEWILQ